MNKSFYFQNKDKDPLAEHLKADKAIVFLSCLLQLFTVCQQYGCGAAIDPANRKYHQEGAVIVIKYTCNASHTHTWSSSPAVGEGKKKVWVMNAILAIYSLTCGLHISQVIQNFHHSSWESRLDKLDIYIGKLVFCAT